MLLVWTRCHSNARHSTAQHSTAQHSRPGTARSYHVDVKGYTVDVRGYNADFASSKSKGFGNRSLIDPARSASTSSLLVPPPPLYHQYKVDVKGYNEDLRGYNADVIGTPPGPPAPPPCWCHRRRCTIGHTHVAGVSTSGVVSGTQDLGSVLGPLATLGYYEANRGGFKAIEGGFKAVEGGFKAVEGGFKALEPMRGEDGVEQQVALLLVLGDV
eukprot:1185177-Prorocentrum_minimum.AAC.2